MTKLFSPVNDANRIAILDGLRGLAIFGILMVNFPLMFAPITNILLGSQSDGNVLNLMSEWFLKFFFEGKFYVVFSLLFGYGFYMFLNRKTDEGVSIVPVFRRRLFILFLFGALHVSLLWAGDILVFYALFGFLLLLFRKVSNRGLIKWAIWVGLIPSFLSLLGLLMVWLASLDPHAMAVTQASFAESLENMIKFRDQALVVYSSGSFTEIVAMRLSEYQVLLPGLLVFYPVVLSMFLVGVWSARKGLIANYNQHIPFFRRVFWWGLGVGVVSNLAYALSHKHSVGFFVGPWEVINAISHTIGGFSLGVFYISAMVLLYARGKVWITHLLAPVGRMALTNYLMHSIIAAVLFHSYGFGLFGKIELWHGVLLSFLIFGLQIPLSHFWLKRFRFGPFEWLWRTLSYMKVQPFIRRD